MPYLCMMYFIFKLCDDAQKISRLNVPNFNGLVVAWNA